MQLFDKKGIDSWVRGWSFFVYRNGRGGRAATIVINLLHSCFGTSWPRVLPVAEPAAYIHSSSPFRPSLLGLFTLSLVPTCAWHFLRPWSSVFFALGEALYWAATSQRGFCSALSLFLFCVTQTGILQACLQERAGEKPWGMYIRGILFPCFFLFVCQQCQLYILPMRSEKWDMSFPCRCGTLPSSRRSQFQLVTDQFLCCTSMC